MKQKLLLIAFTLLGTMLFSQSGTPSVPMAFKFWETNLGTQYMFQKNVTKTDGSGNVFTGGATLNTNGKYDGFLTKVSSGGTVIFTVQINGTANDHDFIAGLYLSGTDVYVTGTITNSVTMIPELFIAKYNSSGTQQFFTTYSNGYGDIGKEIVINTTYNYILVTGASYNSNFDSDMSVTAVDASGNIQWVNYYDHAGLNDGGYKITTRSSMCTITGPVTISANNYKLASVSYSVATGWQSGSVVTGATATSSVEIVSDVVTDASGNMYLCGATQQNAGQGYNMYVAKVTSSLTIAWEQTINGFSGSSLDDYARGIQIDGSSNVYVTGITTHSTQGKNLTTVKLNSSGTVQWTKNINGSFNGHDGATDLAIDGSANVYITGYQTIGNGNTDIYSAKLDNSTGNIIWEKFEESDLNDEGTNLVLDNNDVIVAGSREVTAGNFEYVTYKYVQKDVITPTDFNGESPNIKNWYYENKGQLISNTGAAVPDVKYYSYGTFPAFYFKQNSQSYVFARRDTIAATADTLHRIDLTFNDKLETSNTYPLEKQDINFINYYLAHTGSTGIEKVKGNKRLITTNLYNNIDLMTCSNQRGIKYYFIVKPGADMRDIKLEFTGATSFSLNGTTNALSINSSVGSITFDKPIAYQLTAANATVAVTTFSPTWTTNGATNKYKFNNGTYTSSLTLIIEVDQGNTALSVAGGSNPLWCTDVGSPTYDLVYDVDSDVNGNLYSTGWTDNTLFPNSATINSGGWGNHEAFIISYSPGGTPRWRTIYGGTSIDQGWDVKVDDVNSFVYMTGYTGFAASSPYLTDFPLQNPGGGAFFHNSSAGTNVPYYAFITKFLSSNGTRKWGTLFGDDTGPGETHIRTMDVTSTGDLFIAGTTETDANGFPSATPSTGCTVYTATLPNARPAFIAKFNLQNQLIWSTHFGIDTCIIYDLKVNSQNEIFITGQASAYHNSNFPLLKEFSNDYQHAYNGGSTDAFVAKFSDCLELKWCTFIGGANLDAGTAIEISEGSPAQPKSGKVANTLTYTYISGVTKSTNATFPILTNGNTNSINDNSLGGTQDGFIAGFNSGNEQTWTTYVGGSNIDELNDMEFGRAGTLFLTGSTKSTDFLNVNFTGGYNQTQLENTAGGNDYDALILALDGPTNFTKVWSSWLGGNTSITGYRSDDHGWGITTSNMYVYMGGETWSFNNFPWTADLTTYPNAYYQPYLEGNFSQDGFLVQFDLSGTAISVRELAKEDENGFVVYPNPSNGMVYIVLNEDLVHNNKKLNLQVFDIQGREIISKSVNPMSYEDFSLNLSHVSTGMYFIKLSGENLNKSQKVIINH